MGILGPWDPSHGPFFGFVSHFLISPNSSRTTNFIAFKGEIGYKSDGGCERRPLKDPMVRIRLEEIHDGQ
jgi:hypothetical protein